ncbi:hypothetical protein [Clostridium sp. C8-1-8]|uniref:hypothetical protein n=1 Tax=Clostridium sp. C8-1-8 TaxID=2698831 RepID=UPI001368F568|nr:hypothetical protein [Clostridium sp. C8-1-8]
MGSGFFNDVENMGQLIKRIGTGILVILVCLLYLFGIELMVDKLVVSNRQAQSFLIANTFLNTAIYSVIPAIAILTLVLYFVILRISKRDVVYEISFGAINEIPSKTKIGSFRYNVCFLMIFVFLSAAFFYTIKNYYELSPNKIVRHNIIQSKEILYSYNDIVSCDIKAKTRGRGYTDLVYNINLRDGKSFNAASTIYNEGGRLDAIQVLNDIITEKKIKKNVDKNHYYGLLDGKSENDIKVYEKIFSE